MATEKKNALIIAYNDLNNSGVPNVIYQTIKALHNEFDFDVVVFGNDLYHYQKLVDEGIKNINVINWYKEGKRNKISRALNHLIKDPKDMYKRTLELLSKKEYSVIHSFREYDSWPFLKAAAEKGVQNRIVHSNVIHSEKDSYLVRRNKRRTIKYATTFVGVTKDCCEHAWQGQEYSVIHSGYDDSKFKLSESTLRKDELVLTHISTYSENKNQLFSIKLIKELKVLYPKAKLRIVGAVREKGYFSKMRNAIIEEGVNDWVDVVDGSNGVESFPAKSTFYILPSIHEGASLVVVEAQACGIKVFASTGVPQEMNVGGITYLDLNDGPKKWAEVIYEEFKKSGNARTAYNTTSFSSESFKKNISSLYLK